MTPLLIPHLLRSLARTMQYASVTCAPAAGAHRCMSSIAAALVHTGGRFQTWGNPLYAPLLAQKQQLVALQPSMGMKTKTSLKKRCKDCFFVRRRGRLYVFCKSHPRHKQRQG